MLIQKKIQIDPNDFTFIEKTCHILHYRSKSEYIRAAIKEKIKADTKKLRELKRKQAFAAYGKVKAKNLFEDIEGDDFEHR